MQTIHLMLISCLFTGFFSYSVNLVDGSQLPLSSFAGKKILIVNIATGGAEVGQIQKLEQFYQLHKDSVVVLAFASNSFGNEPKNNVALKHVLKNQFKVTYPVVEISSVSGSNMHPLYEWMSDSLRNGIGSIKITRDFQKILIAEDGKIEAIFNWMVTPLDPKIRLNLKKRKG